MFSSREHPQSSLKIPIGKIDMVAASMNHVLKIHRAEDDRQALQG